MGRAARHTGTTRCQRVAEAVFALDLAFVFSRAEHVERVVARGLLDDEHKAIGRALDRHTRNGLHVNVIARFRNDHVLRQSSRVNRNGRGGGECAKDVVQLRLRLRGEHQPVERHTAQRRGIYHHARKVKRVRDADVPIKTEMRFERRYPRKRIRERIHRRRREGRPHRAIVHIKIKLLCRPVVPEFVAGKTTNMQRRPGAGAAGTRFWRGSVRL